MNPKLSAFDRLIPGLLVFVPSLIVLALGIGVIEARARRAAEPRETAQPMVGKSGRTFLDGAPVVSRWLAQAIAPGTGYVARSRLGAGHLVRAEDMAIARNLPLALERYLTPRDQIISLYVKMPLLPGEAIHLSNLSREPSGARQGRILVQVPLSAGEWPEWLKPSAEITLTLATPPPTNKNPGPVKATVVAPESAATTTKPSENQTVKPGVAGAK